MMSAVSKKKTTVAAPAPNGRDVWVSFTIRREIAAKLDEVAAREDRSRASVIRRLIQKYHDEVLEQPA